jgi:hypothetical protein
LATISLAFHRWRSRVLDLEPVLDPASIARRDPPTLLDLVENRSTKFRAR